MHRSDKVGHCAMCGRRKELTFHHLIPRECHTNRWFRSRFSRSEMLRNGLDLCFECHRYVHRVLSRKELGRRYNSLEALLSEARVSRYVAWVRRKR